MKIIYSQRITTISSSEFIVVTKLDELIKLIFDNSVFELILDLEHESTKNLKKLVFDLVNCKNILHCVTLPSSKFDICNLPFVRNGEIVNTFSQLLIATSRLV